jgi:hypothetical protein
LTEWEDPSVEPAPVRSIGSTVVMILACATIWAIHLTTWPFAPRALPSDRVGKLAGQGLGPDHNHSGGML